MLDQLIEFGYISDPKTIERVIKPLNRLLSGINDREYEGQEEAEAKLAKKEKVGTIHEYARFETFYKLTITSLSYR